MQHDHDDPSGNAAADMQLEDMLGLGDTSMADFANSDFVPDLDLADFDDASLTNEPNNPPSNPYHSQHQHQQQHHHPLPNSSGAIQPSIESSAAENGALQTATINNNTDDEDDALMSGIGAGPLPTGFGISLPPNAGSTLTEFTKRRNWSQRVVEEIKDFLHILTPDGRLMYVSPSASVLTGYEPQDLVGKIMANFIHPDDSGMFMREFHESIASGHPLRFFYRLRKADQTYTIFEAHGHPHFSSDVTAGFSGGNSQGVSFCRGFFMMSRPYPSRNASLLDSFLEHKIENERLKKRIADLNREEHEDAQELYTSKSRPSSVSGPGQADRVMSGSLTPLGVSKLRQDSASGDSGVQGSAADSDYQMMPPPAKPGVSNFALTQRNLDEALSASRPDSIKDKMMRFEGANHLEGIEMMTGLRYRDGERSKGISTGAMSPLLVKGDQGIEYPVDRPGRRNSTDRTRSYADSPSRAFGAGDAERKKKLKVADEYVCTDCGTLDSPEWRRGPNGPKTLCNACGLRWAKQEKKRTGTGSSSKNGNGDSSNRQSTSGGNGTAGSPTTMTPKPSSSQASPTGTGPPAHSAASSGGGSGSMPATTMPIFTGNMASAPPQMSINVAAAQAAQGGSGMTGSPMSGLSPMTTSALTPGGMQNGIMPGPPGMPTVIGGSGSMASMGFNQGHRASLGNAPGMYHGGAPGQQRQGMGHGS